MINPLERHGLDPGMVIAPGFTLGLIVAEIHVQGFEEGYDEGWYQHGLGSEDW